MKTVEQIDEEFRTNVRDTVQYMARTFELGGTDVDEINSLIRDLSRHRTVWKKSWMQVVLAGWQQPA